MHAPAETDEAAVLRDAWTEMASGLPEAERDLIVCHRFTEAALDLLDTVIGSERLVGWRLTYTSVGGPYGATLFVRQPGLSGLQEICSAHEGSASLAILETIRQWRQTEVSTGYGVAPDSRHHARSANRLKHAPDRQ